MGHIGYDSYSGTRFTDDFLPSIQIRWKLRLVVIPLLAIRSQQFFAHATTAQLSCHSQNSVVITKLELRWEGNAISIEFEWRWKNRWWKGALVAGRTQYTCTMWVASCYGRIISFAYKIEWLKARRARHIGSDTKWPPIHILLLYVNYFILAQMSLKYYPNYLINKPTWSQILVRRQSGDRPFAEPVLAKCVDARVCVTRPQWINCLYDTLLSKKIWYRFIFEIYR